MLRVAPICVPLGEVHVAGASTLQRKNFSVPLQFAAPLIAKSAESFTDTEPVPIDKPPAGMSSPPPVFGVVVSPDTQWPKFPRTKSFSVEVVEVDDRDSEPTLATPPLSRPSKERLMPPSKNSPCR